MRQALVENFKNIGLTLKLLDKPIRRGRRGTEEIFQMDIERKVEGTRRTEWFTIYPGHEDNVIHIIDIDQKINSDEIMKELKGIPETIKTRMLL